MHGAGDMVVTGMAALTPGCESFEEAAAATGGRSAQQGWFDAESRLGRRGYKYLPPACQYWMVAARGAIEDAGGSLAGVPPEARAAVVGINGAASSLHTGMDATIVAESTDGLSPMGAPFFSINLFSSRLATEHQLKAFNLTTMSPRVAALEALEIGLRSVHLGRASWLLAGATEAPLAAGEPGGEDSEDGAAAMVLETALAARRRGARPYGSLRVRSAFLAPAVAGGRGGERRAEEILDGALRAVGVAGGSATVERVLLVDDSPVGLAVAAALGGAARRVRPGAGCLGPLLQAGSLLRSDGVGRERLLVTASAEGNVAVLLACTARVRGAGRRRQRGTVRANEQVA
jgi:3-oxoacyl-[acyl-carrier-protein] synthase II